VEDPPALALRCAACGASSACEVSHVRLPWGSRWPTEERRQPAKRVAAAFGVSAHTMHKWLARFRAEGLPGLQDRCPG
jgi:hypothetical protein